MSSVTRWPKGCEREDIKFTRIPCRHALNHKEVQGAKAEFGGPGIEAVSLLMLPWSVRKQQKHCSYVAAGSNKPAHFALQMGLCSTS